MSSKTKIVVLHLKELIYTGIFALLGILFIVLIIIMFLPNDKKEVKQTSSSSIYVPGVYSTSLVLGGNTIDIEVVVDESNINSIRLVNLDEAVATMYPLINSNNTFIKIIGGFYHEILRMFSLRQHHHL